MFYVTMMFELILRSIGKNSKMLLLLLLLELPVLKSILNYTVNSVDELRITLG